jgi:RNA 2',3'-cyclic 3'-phosphodiesterase
MKRIFVAVKVDPDRILLDMISSLKSGLIKESIKWTNLDNIHITLVFLGDTEDKMIDPISTKLGNNCSASGKFRLTIRGLGLFRNLKDPRIIWTGIDPSSDLINLNKSIITGIKEAGIKVEERPFNPHLTLGRIKHLDDREVLDHFLEKYYNTEIQEVQVNEVILYESILKPTGPVYIPIRIYKL